MDKDVSKSIYEAVSSDFEREVKNSGRIKLAAKAIKDGTASHYQTSQIARELGVISSRSFLMNIFYGTLPDDKMYYNIAMKTVYPIMEQCFRLTKQSGDLVQAAMNKRLGTGFKPVPVKFDMERHQGLTNALTAADGLVAIRSLLGEPLRLTIWKDAIDYQKAQIEFTESGMI